MAAVTQVLLDLKKDEGRHHTNAKHLQAPWRIVTAQGMLDPSALSEGDGQRGGAPASPTPQGCWKEQVMQNM